MRTDLPEAVEKASVPVTLGAPLGPDPLLAQAQVARLLEAGAIAGQRVVLVAAGSTDEAATCDQMAAVALLARAWNGPVELATLSGHGTRPAEVVRPGDAVSPYLLSPGFFHDRVRRESPDGVVVADVIGAHELVVDLVVARAQALAGCVTACLGACAGSQGQAPCAAARAAPLSLVELPPARVNARGAAR